MIYLKCIMHYKKEEEKYKDRITDFNSITDENGIKNIEVITDEGTVYDKYYDEQVSAYVAVRHFFNWLCKEASDLKEEEKTYLRNLIKPFKKDVKSITKKENNRGYEWLSIIVEDNEPLLLPGFKKGTQYKGLELDKKYTRRI